MFGSLQIGSVRGIPIRLHFTLLVMAALFVVRFGFTFGVGAWVVLLASVLLHELGHALVAQRYGVHIAGISLHMLGGMALMARPPRTPRQELVIAAAGPAVSLLLGGALLLLSVLAGADLDLTRLPDLIAFGAAVNFGMFTFNLIPALPMDGGRIFRAAMATRLGGLRATRIAAKVSRVLAVAGIALGVVTGAWSYVLIGGLLLLMVGQEERAAEAQALLARAAEPRVHHTSEGPVVDVGEEPRRVLFTDAAGRTWVVMVRPERP